MVARKAQLTEVLCRELVKLFPVLFFKPCSSDRYEVSEFGASDATLDTRIVMLTVANNA